MLSLCPRDKRNGHKATGEHLSTVISPFLEYSSFCLFTFSTKRAVSDLLPTIVSGGRASTWRPDIQISLITDHWSLRKNVEALSRLTHTSKTRKDWRRLFASPEKLAQNVRKSQDKILRQMCANQQNVIILCQIAYFLNYKSMISVCFYLRFKQCFNMIWRKLAVLSINTVQTKRVLGSQQKKNKWRNIPKIGGVLSPGSPSLWMYALTSLVLNAIFLFVPIHRNAFCIGTITGSW